MKRVTRRLIVIFLITFICMNVLFPHLIKAIPNEIYEQLDRELDDIVNTQIEEQIKEKEKQRDFL